MDFYLPINQCPPANLVLGKGSSRKLFVWLTSYGTHNKFIIQAQNYNYYIKDTEQLHNQLMWVACSWNVHRAKSVASNITVFVQLKLFVFTVIIWRH